MDGLNELDREQRDCVEAELSGLLSAHICTPDFFHFHFGYPE